MTAQQGTTVEVLENPAELASHVAERLVEHLVMLQAEGRVPSVVLTGGSVADQVHAAVLRSPAHREVDWSRVEVWYGDERYVPADDDDRNALHARRALLDHLPLDPARVHEMPATGAGHATPEAAAAAYEEELLRVLGDRPRFDVLMLGIGPDGHCASLFPGHDAVRADGLTVAVHDSPKPPPTRLSLTMHALGIADEVWFMATGSEKADAVSAAVSGDDVDAVPASGPEGRDRTRWFLDAGAAAGLDRDPQG